MLQWGIKAHHFHNKWVYLGGWVRETVESTIDKDLHAPIDILQRLMDNKCLGSINQHTISAFSVWLVACIVQGLHFGLHENGLGLTISVFICIVWFVLQSFSKDRKIQKFNHSYLIKVSKEFTNLLEIFHGHIWLCFKKH
jgi:hypothetical protein